MGKYKCDKCRIDTEGKKIYVEGSQGFRFCPSCAKIVDEAPTSFSIQQFIAAPKKESKK